MPATTIFTFLRHATAEQVGDNHRFHHLSPKGVEEAKARRVQLGNPKFDLNICSPLARTHETANEVSGGNTPTVTATSLFPEDSDPNLKVVNELYAELGHASLRKYLERAYLQIMTLAMVSTNEIFMITNKRRAKNVLVVGHGMFTPATCSQMMRQTDNPVFMDRVLKETEGYRLTFVGSTPTTIEPI